MSGNVSKVAGNGLVSDAQTDGAPEVPGKVVTGTSGDDWLRGGDGDDTLIGGAGEDVLSGGKGDDVYRFNLNDGHDRVIDFGGNDTVSFGEGISREDLVFSMKGNSLVIDIAGTEDSLTLAGWYGDSSFKVETLELSDGTVINAEELGSLGLRAALDAAESGSLPGGVVDPLAGDPGDNIIVGTDGADTLLGGDGNDVVYGGDGNDLLFGGNGNDVLIGGAGGDVLISGPGSGVAFGGSGNDIMGGSEGADVLMGGDDNDHVSGGSGDDVISGGKGNDWLYAGAGSDLLLGGDGNDTYDFNLGDGQDTIVETEGNDKVFFDLGIKKDDLLFSREGSDLTVGIIGSDDGLTIKGWYESDAAKVESFTLLDGFETISAAEVQSLVDAMSSYAPTEAGVITAPNEIQDDVQNIITADWQKQ